MAQIFSRDIFLSDLRANTSQTNIFFFSPEIADENNWQFPPKVVYDSVSSSVIDVLKLSGSVLLITPFITSSILDMTALIEKAISDACLASAPIFVFGSESDFYKNHLESFGEW